MLRVDMNVSTIMRCNPSRIYVYLADGPVRLCGFIFGSWFGCPGDGVLKDIAVLAAGSVTIPAAIHRLPNALPYVALRKRWHAGNFAVDTDA